MKWYFIKTLVHYTLVLNICETFFIRSEQQLAEININAITTNSKGSKLSVANSSYDEAKCGNQDYEAVHANKLEIVTEAEGKPVFGTVNIPDYSCFKSDENVSDGNCYPVKNTDVEGIQSTACNGGLLSESCLDQSVPNSAETKALISSLKDQDKNVSLTSKPIVKSPTVSLKIVVDLKGRKRKYRVNMKQSMEKLVCKKYIVHKT